MAGEWRRVRLGDVAEINPDSINSAWPYSHIRYIDISSVGEGILIEPPQVMSLAEAPSRAKRLVQEGDTVLSTVRPGRRSMFYVKRAEPDLVVSTGFAVLRPRKGCIEPRYLYACIYDKAFTEFLVKREKGAAYPAVLPEDIADAMINLPTLAEQRAIAHILGTLDDKIELNRRMSETLEQMARTIFKAWFVDFEPVRAKMEGRWRRGQSLPGLPAHLYDLFPDRLNGRGFPDGWQLTTLGQHVDIERGIGYSTRELTTADSGVPLHNLNSVREGGGYKYEGIKFYKGPFDRRHVTRPGDVIVANTEQGHDRLLIGYAAVVPSLYGGNGLVSHHIYRLQVKESSYLTPAFICYLLNSRTIHEAVSNYATGTTVNMLPKDALRHPRFVLPPPHLIAYFNRIVTLCLQRQEQLVVETQAVAAVRDALLPKLVGGLVRIHHPQKILGGHP